MTYVSGPRDRDKQPKQVTALNYK